MLVTALCMACSFRAKISKKLWPPYFKIWPLCFKWSDAGTVQISDSINKLCVFLHTWLKKVIDLAEVRWANIRGADLGGWLTNTFYNL